MNGKVHELKRRQIELEAVVEAVTEGIVIADAQGNLLTMNRAALALKEFKSADESFWKLSEYPALFQIHDLNGDFLPLDRWPMSRALRGERFVGYEVRVRRMDTGTEIIASYGGTPVLDADGRVSLAVLTIRDVTAERRVEEAMRVAESKYRAIFEATRDGLIINTPDGTIVEANPAACEMHGFTYEQFVGLEPRRFIHPDDLHLFQNFVDVTTQGGEFRTEARDIRSDGTAFPVEVSGTSFSFGGKMHLLGVVRDITDRKNVERSLAESQKRLQTLFANTQDAILLTSDEGRFVDANPAASTLTGYRFEEIIKRSIWELTPAPNRELGLNLWRQFMEAGKQEGEYALVRKDGSFIDVEYRAVAHILPGLHLSVLRDVTERKRFVEKLRDSAERLNLALAAANLGDWQWDPQTDMITLSERAAEIFGLPSGQIATRESMRDLIEEKDRDRTREASKRAVAEHGDYDVEYQVNRADGKSIWVAAKGRGQYDSNGKIIRMIGIVQDVTYRKKAEDHRREALEKEHAARVEAERSGRMKDEFLATLGHELRTPLNAILGWSQILRSGPSDADDLAQGLETIERNARAQTRIIEDLLDMSRIISGKIRLDVQPINLATVVEAAIETVRHAAEAKGIRLHVNLDRLAGLVSGDASRLQQVFWNLLSNAVKFSSGGGCVQVLLKRQDLHVEVSVIDDGEGIRPEFLPHVFDRFQQADASTTRRHGGLGLGLSIVKQLVELHGGSVIAASPGPRQGSTFVVTLPVAATTASPEAKETQHPPAIQSNARAVSKADRSKLRGVKVLVVDDEADARMLIKRLLTDADATVTTAASAEEALKMIQNDLPDVLVSDIGMPVADGYALVRRIRALGVSDGGGIPAVALTAYARAEDRTHAVLAGFQMHVAKPVEPSELITIVASLAGRMKT